MVVFRDTEIRGLHANQGHRSRYYAINYVCASGHVLFTQDAENCDRQNAEEESILSTLISPRARQDNPQSVAFTGSRPTPWLLDNRNQGLWAARAPSR